MSTVTTILLSVVGILLAYRWLRYISTPILRKIGAYVYYAPMFFTVRIAPKLYELHLGTSWDFVRSVDRSQRAIMQNLVKGLLGIANDGRLCNLEPDARLRGFMYFLRPRSLERFGFTCRRPRPLEILGFALSYIETSILLSLVKRRVSFVDVRNIWVAESTVLRVLDVQPMLIEFHRQLSPPARTTVTAASAVPRSKHVLNADTLFQ